MCERTVGTGVQLCLLAGLSLAAGCDAPRGRDGGGDELSREGPATKPGVRPWPWPTEGAVGNGEVEGWGGGVRVDVGGSEGGGERVGDAVGGGEGEGEAPLDSGRPVPLPLICPGEAVCRPGELRCGSGGGEARPVTLGRCRQDCSGFDVVRHCSRPTQPGVAPGRAAWPEVCGTDPLTDEPACLPCACVPGDSRCSDDAGPGGVERCVDKCTGWKPSAGCDEGMCCQQEGRSAVCRGQVSLPGSAWCEGSVSARCVEGGCGPVERVDCDPFECVAEEGRCEDCLRAPEVCNGLDDDCDGALDEDFLVVAPIRLEPIRSKLLLLLDMSGSMRRPADKYPQVRAAISQVLDRLDGAFLFGFDPFPDHDGQGRCDVADPVLFDCDLGNEAGIAQWLQAHSPTWGDATPLVHQLDALLGDPGYAPGCLSDGLPGPLYVVVVSDGEDSCLYGRACANSCVGELTRRTEDLLSDGVRTIAVGYGADADVRALNAIAAAGGTQFDEYLPARDHDGLVDALSAIASSIAGCRLEVASPEAVADPEAVNLVLDGEVVPYDDGCAQGVGWTWTDDEHTEIELCEQTCAEAQDGQAELVLLVGCPTVDG